MSADGRTDRAFARLAGSATPRHLFVPGRIEVLGKHTDYAGGRSLTCATERGFSVLYRRRNDRRLRIVDARDDRQLDVPLDGALQPRVGDWSNYPMTVARRLARNFPSIDSGADVAFYSTLPKAAGLSTSSALIIAVFHVLADVNDLRSRDEFVRAIPDVWHLAGYLGAMESGDSFGRLAGDSGVGTSGGSEDHTAILLSQADRLTSYRYHPVAPDRGVTLDPGLVFVVAASGISASKTGSARDGYNRASALAAELVRIARNSDPGARIPKPEVDSPQPVVTLGDVLATAGDALGQLRSRLSDATSSFPVAELERRLEHFVVEDGQLLPAALDALAARHLETFGRLVDQSQRAAEELLGNQVPETVTLARLARQLGAYAASSFGAGFGGSVWALVDMTKADGFAEAWLDAYASQHPDASIRASAFVTRPSSGVLSTR